MAPKYLTSGLKPGSGDALVKDLQRDLRALGYARKGIDGKFGEGTAAAVRALQFDLQYNDGKGEKDGSAPVVVKNYNKGRVSAITGMVDAGTATVIGEMLEDQAFPKLPASADPKAANAAVVKAITDNPGTNAPTPFLLAMFQQESGGQHYYVPAGTDDDNFVVLGLDRNHAGVEDHITSRGYGIGQYTIFHHPPTQVEVDDFILDPVRNVAKAYAEFRDKFDDFVVGKDSAHTADDRKAEHPLLPLRLCKYSPSDPKYMQDCKACAKAAPRIDLAAGSPLYPGSSATLQPTKYYASASYPQVPNRAAFGCDWPYAARRYNGSGVNSYHYQARILRNLATMT
jgi:peptidoglycan hydrolase-like protein with peptidoglycan-binding domain